MSKRYVICARKSVMGDAMLPNSTVEICPNCGEEIVLAPMDPQGQTVTMSVDKICLDCIVKMVQQGEDVELIGLPENIARKIVEAAARRKHGE